MKYKIKGEELSEIFDEINVLEDLLTERIVELNDENKGQGIINATQAQHAYMFYRRLLCDLRASIANKAKEIKDEKK